MEKTKKGFKTPNAFVIVFTIMVLAMIATYLVPAGTYDTMINAAGKEVIDPNSFHFVEQTPFTLWEFCKVIYNGLVKQASVIFYLYMLGGFFQIILDTDAIDAAIGSLVTKYGDKAVLVIPVVMLFMSLLGASGVLVNPVVAVIPVGLLLAKKLKVDQIAAVAIIFAACYQGFGCSMMCASTVQYAQQLADIPVLSGFGFRTAVWAVMYVVTVWYVLRYVQKVRKDKNNSIIPEQMEFEADGVKNVAFTAKHAAILVIFIAAICLYVFGALSYQWGNAEMTGIMFVAILIICVIARINPDKMINSFIKGCNLMTFGCMLIGLAVSVAIILQEGQIVDTIVYYLSLPLTKIPNIFQGAAMYIMNVIFNFFVSSGSSQAAIVMPLMAPLADILGITRQIAVAAYHYGDGLSNLIFPTNGTLMACLAVAGLRLDKWLKFMVPLFAIWSVVIMISLTIGVGIGVA